MIITVLVSIILIGIITFEVIALLKGEKRMLLLTEKLAQARIEVRTAQKELKRDHDAKIYNTTIKAILAKYDLSLRVYYDDLSRGEWSK